MKILHYSLGFPPYRTGGLTKFNYDLMQEQVKEGYDVALLWPGAITLIDNKTKIKKAPSVNKIESYEIINPIPVSYDEGITDIATFTDCGDKDVYTSFLRILQPDVIHVHTLMGLHNNFLVAAKEQGIRLVFTTHDFFPICPKVTMFREGKECPTIGDCSFCPHCNLTALSSKKMQILQSPLYRKLKDSRVIKKLRKSQRDKYLSENIEVTGKETLTAADYIRLRDHYRSMLELMDIIHYNSSLTKCVYDKYIGFLPGKIVPITHGDIKDHRKIKYFSDHLRITYLSAQSGAKGYYLLKETLDEIWRNNNNFELNVFFTPVVNAPYIRSHDRYTYGELKDIFDETDILVAPSIWYETFGFTVLEAMSYGVPVIISDHVGAKDIVPDRAGIIVKAGSKEHLKNAFTGLTREKLTRMNGSIISASFDYGINQFSNVVSRELYQNDR
ncbi:MAG: glycosyltransferase [Erysipelotrichaceae bacterium]|nr:glycosyltransferase [Erysipelotrichaceae bacterium]